MMPASGGRGVLGEKFGDVEKVELLAPAGTPDAFRAAVAAGADAIYVGMGAYNARAANGGFSPEELARCCDLAHGRGVRVYMTLNACLHDGELDPAIELAGEAVSSGADALIVADLGLCARLRRDMPHAEIHLSTQAGVQSAPAALFAARRLGVSRVTCARELTVSEIAELCDTGTPVEAFCHGAICICYSGACSYSTFMRGRSANRGDCTQPCRLAYELQDGSGHTLAGGRWERGVPFGGDRLLCPRDYLGIGHVSELVRAGVASLKIEGRMKGPDYVHNVVRCYREALDVVLGGGELGEDRLASLESRLALSFNRGFTDSYLRGGRLSTGSALMSRARAINQGLKVGRVERVAPSGAFVALERDVAQGDMLEIRSVPGADAPADVPQRWPIVPCPVDARQGESVLVGCKRKVEVGSAVHVVRSERASADALEAISSVQFDIDSLAREAAGPSAQSGLDASRHAHARRKSPRAGACDRSGEPTTDSPQAGDVRSDVHEGDGATICDGSPSVDGSATSGGAGKDTAPASGRVIDLGEVCRSTDVGMVLDACASVLRGDADAVLCRNIGQVEIACAEGVAWEAAPPLNVWNAETVRVLRGLGARRVWLSEELSAREVDEVLDALRRRPDDSDPALSILQAPLGTTPLMVMEHCILTAEGPCDGACESCPRRLASQRGDRFLIELDRKSAGARLPVLVDGRGRTRIVAPESSGVAGRDGGPERIDALGRPHGRHGSASGGPSLR